jgi:hypothetical protein
MKDFDSSQSPEISKFKCYDVEEDKEEDWTAFIFSTPEDHRK